MSPVSLTDVPLMAIIYSPSFTSTPTSVSCERALFRQFSHSNIFSILKYPDLSFNTVAPNKPVFMLVSSGSSPPPM